jgi:hypothetical protein
MEGRPKMSGVGKMYIGQVETRGNRQEGLNGDQVTPEKQKGRVANCRETSEWRVLVYTSRPYPKRKK